MTPSHRMSQASYRAQLADVVRRAKVLETRARNECAVLQPEDPQYVVWRRIERRYATVRGNAEHLLFIYNRRRLTPAARLRRYVAAVLFLFL